MEHTESNGPDVLLASLVKRYQNQGSSLGAPVPSGGPDILLASLIKNQASESLGQCHHDAAAEDTDDEDMSDGDAMQYTAELLAAHPELALDFSMPMEGSFKEKFRRLKKAGASAFRTYRKTRKEDKVKKAAKLKPSVPASEPTKTMAEPAPASPSPLAKPGTSIFAKTVSSSTSSAPSPAKTPSSTPTLSVGSQQLLTALKTLIHQDIDTSLSDLSTVILASKTNPHAYYANIALASTIGTLRLPVEAQMKNGMDIDNMVTKSRGTSLKKTTLDSQTLENLHNIMTIFALEVNRLSTGPGINKLEKAIGYGSALGGELVSNLTKTYMLNENSILSESHPVVRLGAILTSLLGITQAQISYQPEINAIVHAAIKPIWSHPLTQGTLNEVVINCFE